MLSLAYVTGACRWAAESAQDMPEVHLSWLSSARAKAPGFVGERAGVVLWRARGSGAELGRQAMLDGVQCWMACNMMVAVLMPR